MGLSRDQLKQLAVARRRPPYRWIGRLPDDLRRDLLAFWRRNRDRDVLGDMMGVRDRLSIPLENKAYLSSKYGQVLLQGLVDGGDAVNAEDYREPLAPALVSAVQRLVGPFHKARLSCLAPGGEISEHVDNPDQVRVLCLLSGDHTFTLRHGKAPVRVPMPPGALVFVNTAWPHSVVNTSGTERVALMLNLSGDADRLMRAPGDRPTSAVGPGVPTYPPEQNPFETLMVDLTHRCNMACANCYIPDRDQPDMDVEQLYDCLARLPRRTNIRLAGAEATMRRDLPDIIARIRGLGHRVVLLTNGLRLANTNYVTRLRAAGLRHVYVSMNGADNDDWYGAIDGMRCADKKLAAVRNVVDARMILNTGTILARGVNDGVVERMLGLVQNDLRGRHALIRFKNIGALGRYDKESERRNYAMAEMVGQVARAIGRPARELDGQRMIKGIDDRNTRLFPVIAGTPPGQGVWIKITDWQRDASGRVDAGSKRRGRVTDAFQVAPFFEMVGQ